ncbi:orotate phosphoribosyltransferase [Defluviicoccus vanus]|uniref:Orotate phosphoribosyltransferase n=1 Tax=Defluviicoccus vanus TaxID=111831 RepID=A0A7H1MYD4_9PROT|nr:orotate phosphoribosyltransferase [Defluviicoccus vanus]QNT68470.1 orotate phosphoribosyltransferase [Defluviicoccus vanus]
MSSLPATPTGHEAASILLDIGAVGIRPAEPFTFTSGWVSPVYIDCRRLISFPAERSRIIALADALIDREIGYAAVDAIAGGETAGIPYAAWLADRAAKPMLYVRKKPKGFGRDAQIEGVISDDAHVLLVEDLATDGASKLAFAEALRRAGARVTEALVVFFYGIFPGSIETLQAAGLRLHWLATWWDIIAAAEARRHLHPDELREVRQFLADPVAWSAARGGRAAL